MTLFLAGFAAAFLASAAFGIIVAAFMSVTRHPSIRDEDEEDVFSAGEGNLTFSLESAIAHEFKSDSAR